MKNKTSLIEIDINSSSLKSAKTSLVIEENIQKKYIRQLSTSTLNEIEVVIEKNLWLLSERHDGLSSIHFALINPNIEVLKYIVKKYQQRKLDINVASYLNKETYTGLCFLKGETVLDLAISLDNVEKFQFLIEVGANKIAQKNLNQNMNLKEYFNYYHFIKDMARGVSEQELDDYLVKHSTILTSLFLKNAKKILDSLNITEAMRKAFSDDILPYLKIVPFFENKTNYYYSHFIKGFKTNKIHCISNFDFSLVPELFPLALENLKQFDFHNELNWYYKIKYLKMFFTTNQALTYSNKDYVKTMKNLINFSECDEGLKSLYESIYLENSLRGNANKHSEVKKEIKKKVNKI